MAWRSKERLDARNYRDLAERSAYRAGYSDGYNRAPKGAGNEASNFPNAYSAGYWDGQADVGPSITERMMFAERSERLERGE